MMAINTNARKSYAQTTSSNISDVLKLKENYPSLSAKKIEDIHRIIVMRRLDTNNFFIFFSFIFLILLFFTFLLFWKDDEEGM